jgi:hypothetical protein
LYAIVFQVPDKKNNDVIMLELNKEVDESKDKVTALDRFSTSKLDKKMTNCKAVGFTGKYHDIK